ncbi:MAG: 3-phosphoshikimate 1-carboxyvinyltransferase, partial [Pyrinomonadaceae bacterium]
MDLMKINPANHIAGTITLPGDKSISHRAAIFSAMAEGESKIENFSSAADCTATLDCLQNLGVKIERKDSTIFIRGVGKNGFQKPAKELDCGNSGTTVRLLAGVLAGQNFESVLKGDASLSVRPMKRVITPLEKMGARIESENNCLPMKIYGKNPLRSIEYEMPVASA